MIISDRILFRKDCSFACHWFFLHHVDFCCKRWFLETAWVFVHPNTDDPLKPSSVGVHLRHLRHQETMDLKGATGSLRQVSGICTYFLVICFDMEVLDLPNDLTYVWYTESKSNDIWYLIQICIYYIDVIFRNCRFYRVECHYLQQVARTALLLCGNWVFKMRLFGRGLQLSSKQYKDRTLYSQKPHQIWILYSSLLRIRFVTLVILWNYILHSCSHSLDPNDPTLFNYSFVNMFFLTFSWLICTCIWGGCLLAIKEQAVVNRSWTRCRAVPMSFERRMENWVW